MFFPNKNVLPNFWIWDPPPRVLQGGGELRSAIFRNFRNFRNFSAIFRNFRNFRIFPAIFRNFWGVIAIFTHGNI